MSDPKPYRFAIPGITYKCPLIHSIASSWGHDTTHWFPSPAFSTNPLLHNDPDSLPTDLKQLLAQLAQQSGRAGRAAAHALLAESVERRESVSGGRGGVLLVADVEYALARLADGGGQRRAGEVMGLDDEPVPQRKGRLAIEPRLAVPEGSEAASAAAEDENVALAFENLSVTDDDHEGHEGMDYGEDGEEFCEDDGDGVDGGGGGGRMPLEMCP